MSVLYLVGDSTVADYDLTCEDKFFAYPRNGYGMWVNRYLSGSVFVKNLALSGRSSLSFISEDNYKILKERIKRGDYLVIAFGHNDEKFKDVLRFTSAEGDENDEKSFSYHLYNYYIKLARSVGAIPILCTPIVRRSPNDDYSGDRIHCIGDVECDGVKYLNGNYSEVIRKLGKKFDITVIDMTKNTKELYKKLGATKSAELHATLSMDKNDVDNTHLNSFGAAVIAKLFAESLKKSDCDLKEFVKSEQYVPLVSDRIENVLD